MLIKNINSPKFMSRP